MRRTLIMLFATLCLAGLVHAKETQWDPSWGCDAEYSGAECDALVEGDGGNQGGGSYAFCVARKSKGQMCQDVVTITIPDSICATGCRMCASVEYSGSCSCKSDTLKLEGSCTYW